MTLADVMTPHPIAVRAAASVRDALEELEGGTIRHLPVVDEGLVVGMLSDRDLRPWRNALQAVREGAEGAAEEVLARPVRAFMRTDVLCLDVSRPIVDAIDVMLDFKVGAVPVVDNERLVGIVSYVDLLELLKTELSG